MYCSPKGWFKGWLSFKYIHSGYVVLTCQNVQNVVRIILLSKHYSELNICSCISHKKLWWPSQAYLFYFAVWQWAEMGGLSSSWNPAGRTQPTVYKDLRRPTVSKSVGWYIGKHLLYANLRKGAGFSGILPVWACMWLLRYGSHLVTTKKRKRNPERS